MFSEFDEEPDATASIAQVHQARLLNGTRVAVKVRKPGIENKVRMDLEIMLDIATILQQHLLPVDSILRPIDIVSEFRKAVLNELDFLNEARNLSKVGVNFSHTENCVIPRVYHEYSSSGLLVMEYIDGIRITDVKSTQLVKTRLANDGFLAMLKMIFEDGLFHADPHPSNIFATKEGKVAFLDLGLVGELTGKMKNRFFQLLGATFQKDFQACADVLYAMGEEIGLKPEKINREAMLQDLKIILDTYVGISVGKFNVIAAMKELLTRGSKYKVFMPAEYTMVFKALLTIESIGRSLDPNFNITDGVMEFMMQYFMKENTPAGLAIS
jgi:ubiquinone biosynthesis protein